MQAHLNTLMYDGLANYEEAKRVFQADLGDAQTGALTVWQIYTLGYRASRINMTDVSFFPFDFGGTMSEKWAYVKGTVKILDEKIAYPVNHVDIECSRDQGTCTYRQVVLMLPDKNSWVQSYQVAAFSDVIYKITRWEGQQIDAAPLENNACRSNLLSFNFETKEFFEIARNNSARDCKTLGVALPRLDKPRASQIVDGREITNGEFKRIKDEAYSYFSSAFRARIDALSSDKSAVHK